MSFLVHLSSGALIDWFNGTVHSAHSCCTRQTASLKIKKPTQLCAAYSALIWPTFAHVVFMHYEKFQRKKPSSISESVCVSMCVSAVLLERHNTISERTRLSNVTYRHFLSPCLQCKLQYCETRAPLESRFGKGRFDPSTSPQTCVRGRVSAW